MGQLCQLFWQWSWQRDINNRNGIWIWTRFSVVDFLHVYTDKVEALKIVKKFKKARFKAFKSRHEAVEFAIHGSEILTVTSPGVGEDSETQSPVIGEKPSPFKGPKPQELVRLRRTIERGDSEKFTSTVWDNPRYLVSSGDTPAILQVIFSMFIHIGEVLNRISRIWIKSSVCFPKCFLSHCACSDKKTSE